MKVLPRDLVTCFTLGRCTTLLPASLVMTIVDNAEPCTILVSVAHTGYLAEYMIAVGHRMGTVVQYLKSINQEAPSETLIAYLLNRRLR